MFAGGPGGSGFSAILLYGQNFSQSFQDAYDIVTWDPRGVGHTLYALVAVSVPSADPVSSTALGRSIASILQRKMQISGTTLRPAISTRQSPRDSTNGT